MTSSPLYLDFNTCTVELVMCMTR